MSSLLKQIHPALFLALLLLLPSLDGKAQIPAEAANTPTPAGPGTPLPAAGANQEPGGDKTTATTDKSAAPIKPMVIHADHDADIGRTVGRLVEENHYLQKPIDAEMSQRWLKNYLSALDYNHLFFLQSDIDEFTAKYGNDLGNILMHGDSAEAAVAPAFEIFQRYLQRVRENVVLAKSLLHDKYDFTQPGTFAIPTHKSPWLKDAAFSNSIWRDQVKADLLNGLLDKKAPADTIKRVGKRYDSLRREREEMDDLDVIELYLCALTHAYDPHSDYFQPEEAKNFDIQAIDHAVTGIGAILKSDDGYATIDEIISGGRPTSTSACRRATGSSPSARGRGSRSTR